jgi:hypothetical protein
MSNDGKKAVWISTEAHEALRVHCDRTGRTQVEVMSDLVMRVIKPELDRLGGPGAAPAKKPAAKKASARST